MVNSYIWWCAVFASFGGSMQGYDAGAINGVIEMRGFRETFNISYGGEGGNGTQFCDEDVGASAILGLLVSVFSIGCLIGALFAGALSDVIGRKYAIITGGVVYTVGGGLQSGSQFLWMIFVGRFISGVGVGIVFMVVPVYIAELSPKKLRGRLVSFVALQLSAGLMVAFIVNVVCSKFVFGWRISLGLQSLFGLAYAGGMLFFPETPRWLVKKHKPQRAARVLARAHQTDEHGVQEELKEIVAAVEQLEQNTFREVLRMLFKRTIVYRLLLGISLQTLNRFSGIIVITYYSVSIFCKIGVPGFAASVGVGAIMFASTFVSIFLVDKVGRKALLLLGSLAMMITLAAAATLILAFRVEEGGSRVVGYIVLLLIYLFVFNYAYTFGPISWVVNSEIHPLRVRGTAVSVTSSSFWAANVVMTLTSPVLVASPLNIYGTFYIIAGINLMGFLLVLLTLPETKGESLERIETIFSKPWLERVNLPYYLGCGYPWKRKTREYMELAWLEDEDEDEDEAEESL